MKERPAANEFAPYFSTYAELVPEGDIDSILGSEIDGMLAELASVTENQAEFRYAPGKWSMKEVVGHIADTERIMSYRVLRIARGDKTQLPGFDENTFVQGGAFGRISLAELLEDLRTVRQATLSLMRNMEPEAWGRWGNVNGIETTARGMAYVLAGHAIHHRRILAERYLSAF